MSQLLWRVYFMQTMTGQRGPLIQQSESAPWSKTLNAADTVEVTLTKDQLKTISHEWWTPHKGGLLVTLEVEQGEQPFLACIITDLPSESEHAATFSGEGVNFLFEKRVSLDKDYFNYSSTLSASQVDALRKSRISRKGYSLGTIMQELVKHATQKVGGQLPVAFGTPTEIATGLNERNYKGWNLANIGANKLITELSNVINGPDFMFRPEWADDSKNFVVWALYHGTANQPTIHQTWSMNLDTTSEETGVTNPQVKASMADYANTAYWTGAGEDEGTLIRGYQDLAELRSGMPLVEYVGSTSDSENPDLLQSHARSHIHNNKYPRVQVSLDLDGSDDRYRLDRWHVGDSAEVTVKGWLNMPDGTHTLRIISATGHVGSNVVSVEFAEEVNDGTEV